MLSLPSARTVLATDAVARSIPLSGRKILGTNLNCSEAWGVRSWRPRRAIGIVPTKRPREAAALRMTVV
jgi:hypothetical protein